MPEQQFQHVLITYIIAGYFWTKLQVKQKNLTKFQVTTAKKLLWLEKYLGTTIATNYSNLITCT